MFQCCSVSKLIWFVRYCTSLSHTYYSNNKQARHFNVSSWRYVLRRQNPCALAVVALKIALLASISLIWCRFFPVYSFGSNLTIYENVYRMSRLDSLQDNFQLW